MLEALPNSTLMFQLKFLQNMTKLGKFDKKAYIQVKEQIEQKVVNEQQQSLNVSICKQLTDWFVINKDNLIGDEHKIMIQIYTYVTKYFYIFNWEEIQKIEENFFLFSQFQKLPFSPMFKSLIEFQKTKFKHQSINQTKDLLQALNIEVPNKQLQVRYSKFENKLQLHFKSTGQSITIYKINKYDIKSIFKAKKVLQSTIGIKNIILDLPYLTNQEYEETTDQFQTEKEKKLRKLVQTQKSKTFDGSFSSEHILQKQGFLQVLSREQQKFYHDFYLNKKSSQFSIAESEQIVYCPDNLMAKPEPLYSLMYYMVKSKNKSHQKMNIIFGAQTKDHLGLKYALTHTTDEVRAAYNSLRFRYISEQINWAIGVSQRGCPFCNDQNDDEGLPSVIDMASENEYDSKLEDDYFINVILDTMNSQPKDKEFIAYSYNDRLFDYLQNVITNLDKYEEKFFLNQQNMQNLEDSFEKKKDPENVEQVNEFIRNTLQKSIQGNSDLSSIEDQISELSYNEDSKLEFLNRLAMVSALFQIKKIEIPSQMIDQEGIYTELYNQYKEMLTPQSFSNLKEPKSSNCFPSKLLFTN